MSLESFIQAIPKVELHVHLEGSILPETLLKLAKSNKVELPARTIEELRRWYVFTDFPHFAEVYQTISRCIRTTDDIELIARDFLRGQAAQNIRHSQATYTAITQYWNYRLPFSEQLAAINRARAWGKKEFGVSMDLVIDVPRELASPDDGVMVADWAIGGMGNGVTALGLGGYEVCHPPEKFVKAFQRAREAGLPAVPHAGETMGAESIRGALHALHAVRIGHGVRCLEDDHLVDELRERRIPLEVCPTSNVCLKVARTLSEHPFPRLMKEGLYVTINSDDPPIFNTTLTKEYTDVAHEFGLGAKEMEEFSLNALRASLLPEERRNELEKEFVAEFVRLRSSKF